MSKKKFKNKKNDEWEYDETPEVRAAIAKLHNDIRQRKLKEQDDKFNYDTSGKMKLLTLEDYELAGQTFWPKYWYIAKELGEGAKTEDILKCMEAVGGVALKLALEEKSAGPFGFNKKPPEENHDSN